MTRRRAACLLSLRARELQPALHSRSRINIRVRDAMLRSWVSFGKSVGVGVVVVIILVVVGVVVVIELVTRGHVMY